MNPSEDVLVRRYRPDDAEATAAIFHAAVTRTARRHYTRRQVQAWSPGLPDAEAWNRRRLAAWTAVAEVQGRVVGFGDLADAGLLDMLFVHPDAGGRGVGRALVEAVLREAQHRAVPRVTTHASRAARPVFEHLGFVVDAENPLNTIRGVRVPNFDMHLDL